jgi:multimeric flavodoxin WrbA
MKVVLFNGSPRKEGNTHLCLNLVMDELKAAGIECEYIWIGMERLQGCISCYKCFANKDMKCAVSKDKMNEYIEKIFDADGIILGSPTYFADVSTNMKALIERAGLVSKANDEVLKYKVGAAVVAVRRAGAAHVFSSINYFFLIAQMIVVGSSYWNLGVGLAPGDINKDGEGVQTFKNLGKNFAFVLKKIKS